MKEKKCKVCGKLVKIPKGKDGILHTCKNKDGIHGLILLDKEKVLENYK